mmetsp:Transcript_1391/g.3041  ORF Transcript_1391/g.3041 Transcript_1391/m.3041 type:complete len:227 (-) Transcript_1391:33-713(-)
MNASRYSIKFSCLLILRSMWTSLRHLLRLLASIMSKMLIFLRATCLPSDILARKTTENFPLPIFLPTAYMCRRPWLTGMMSSRSERPWLSFFVPLVADFLLSQSVGVSGCSGSSSSIAGQEKAEEDENAEPLKTLSLTVLVSTRCSICFVYCHRFWMSWTIMEFVIHVQHSWFSERAGFQARWSWFLFLYLKAILGMSCDPHKREEHIVSLLASLVLRLLSYPDIS